MQENVSHITNEAWEKLIQQLRYVQENSVYYQRLFKEQGFDSHQANTSDFLNLPYTRKQDLAKFNDDFIAVKPREIIEYVTTSGTLGDPVTFALNENDLQRLALNEAQSFQLIGVGENDVVQITTTLDKRFIAGLAYFLGLRKIGAGIVRVGAGSPALQWDSIQRFKPSYLIVVPSFLIQLAKYAEANDIDINTSSIKGAICIGEALRDEKHELNTLGKKIKSLWDIELFSSYASTEMCTAFTECKKHKGLHVPENLIFTEILNENGEEVQPGEIGELVITTLGVETLPLVRYATGDLVKKLKITCDCESSSALISSVLGRKQQLIKYKGTSIYPQQIVQLMINLPELQEYQIQVTSNELDTDKLSIVIPEEASESLQHQLKEILKANLRVTPLLKLLPLDELKASIFPEGSRKPVRFLDLRKA
ncbi:phenylacetate--CoA ligase family protein [Mesonia ostreae]|uniref:AMP-binding protein n=1 Tax=Mesonia ostreae TaxID=861110 RepID=A0ABU2KI71_9FLAO|nr:AMP-binding protein [Mesonia ostreae]MDT0294369.1 AMP-binding protein [Mesonia ostreae]